MLSNGYYISISLAYLHPSRTIEFANYCSLINGYLMSRCYRRSLFLNVLDRLVKAFAEVGLFNKLKVNNEKYNYQRTCKLNFADALIKNACLPSINTKRMSEVKSIFLLLYALFV